MSAFHGLHEIQQQQIVQEYITNNSNRWQHVITDRMKQALTVPDILVTP